MAHRERISELRGKASFRRRAGNKPPRSVTLIVCEGDTEQEYFAAIRIHYGLSTTEVIIAENTKGSAPISVVRCAEEKCAEPGGYDKVFCVFDRDGHESFDRARDRIKALANRKKRSLPIEEAISIPCFEVWILLHFEQTDAPFGRCADVIRRILDNHVANYEKADAGIARQLMGRADNAVINAEWLEKRAVDNNHNPYTSLHRVLRHIVMVSSQEEAT